MSRTPRLPSLVTVMAWAMAVGAGLCGSAGVAAAQTAQVLHSLSGTTDGANPVAPLIQAADGNFYGTTTHGGSGGAGTVFKMTSGGAFTVLHHFGGSADGAEPYAPLLQASDGSFYGTTVIGGAPNKGTVFRMTPGGDVTVLHEFAGTPLDGAAPYTGLIQAPDGSFYGTTSAGGSIGLGTIFRMTADGTTLTVLYSFAEIAGGSYQLMLAGDGNFYGTASYSAPVCCGAVFKMTTGGAVTILHRFGLENGVPVAFPYGPLVQARDGNLYGVTGSGSYHGVGFSSRFFRMTLDGVVTLLPTHPPAFTRGLTLGPDGALYGRSGSGFGALFRMTTEGVLTLVHAFGGPPFDGGAPYAPLTLGTDGSFYGTTAGGGASGEGVVFRLIDSTQTVERPGPSLAADFDGDARTDLVVYRPSTSEWFVRFSASNYETSTSYHWGLPGDVPLVADFDGDHRADLAVYRPSTGEWFVRFSAANYETSTSYHWGLPGDVPLAADFDGDHRTDLAVYRPSTGEWFVRFSASNYETSTSYHWGLAGDVPLVADFDGDRRTDLAVYRPTTGEWFLRFSRSDYATTTSYQWGLPGDVPLAADFDGDAKADLAVYRPSTADWFVRFSTSDYSYATGVAYDWGMWGDAPLVADFDGDARADLAVWRPYSSEWRVRVSTSDYGGAWVIFEWGVWGDVPL